MSETKVARRYAKALLDMGKEKNIVEEIYNDMLFINSVVKQNRQLGVMFKSPLIKDYKKDAVLTAVFEGKIHKVTLQFLKVINRKNREYFVSDIAAAFLDLYKEYRNIQPAYVTTAVGLDDKSRQAVLDIVNKSTGSTIELHEKVDPSIIGGYILRWNDRQIDASITNKLNSLKKEFSI